MKRFLLMPLSICAAALLVPALLAVADEAAKPQADADGFYSLFDGKTLNGWKVNEKPEGFTVADGAIVVNGERGHAFYNGPVADHDFKDFHFKAEVMTLPKANSGIYFHTKFQPDGWPAAGYECQVNNSQSDRKRTGGLYAVKDVMDTPPVGDNEWFTYEIIVKGKDIKILINGKPTTEWTEPADWTPPKGMEGRKLGRGTFALQAHDPGSKVMYKNLKVKPLE